MKDLEFLMLLNKRSTQGLFQMNFAENRYIVNNQLAVFSDLFTTARASKAWDVVDGALVEYAINAPMLSSKGLGVFDASENLLTHNDGALSSYPVKSGGVSDGTPFITGFSNAVHVGAVAVDTFLVKTSTYAADTDHGFSFYIKMDDGLAPVTGPSSAGSVDFAVIQYTALKAATVESVGGGIYRVAAVADSAASSGQNFGIYKYSTNSDRGFTVLGFQLEEGDFASPIIITEAAAVTRAATTVVNNAAVTDWFNDAEGTIVVEANSYAVSGDIRIVQFDDGLGSNEAHFIRWSDAAAGVISNESVDGGVIQAAITATDAGSLAGTKVAYAYKVNDFEAAQDGASIGTDGGGSVPTSIARLALGQIGSAKFLEGHIKSLSCYDTRLPQAQLEAITS